MVLLYGKNSYRVVTVGAKIYGRLVVKVPLLSTREPDFFGTALSCQRTKNEDFLWTTNLVYYTEACLEKSAACNPDNRACSQN